MFTQRLPVITPRPQSTCSPRPSWFIARQSACNRRRSSFTARRQWSRSALALDIIITRSTIAGKPLCGGIERTPAWTKVRRVFYWQLSRPCLKRFSVAGVVEQLETFLRRKPTLGQDVYIARGAVVIGDVTLGDHSSAWYNAVLRGDINRIVVGHHTNIQDNAVLHVADEIPCLVGNFVTVGHAAILHACTIADEVLVGMGATILDGAVVGERSLIGANALVTQRTQIPPGSLVLGSPARVVRELTAEERRELRMSADKYAENAGYCLQHHANASSSW